MGTSKEKKKYILVNQYIYFLALFLILVLVDLS